MLYIGVDLGTSAVKLLLMDESGKVLNIVSKEYPISFPKPGWSEQNPCDWWEQTVAGLIELTKDFDRSVVAGISFGGQMHGLVVLDENDNVIRPAILWNDGRTQKETDYLNNVIGKEKLSELTGNIAFAGFTAPKILWLKANEPENFARIKKLMLPKDYIAYRMTGVFSTDYSDASGMLLLDVKNKCWSKEMLDICDVREEWLPGLYESSEKTGTLKADVACELGFPKDCIVAAGAGDNAAAAIGTGTVGAGKCNLSLGTSGTLFITSDEFRVDSHNALHSFDHADGGKVVKFLALVYNPDKLRKGVMVPGRFAMTCCIEDVTFIGFKCKYEDESSIPHKSWITITARVHVEFAREYKGKGPVLYPVSIEPAEKPQDELVYFS